MTAEPRDVEGRCGFTIIDRDGMEQPCDRPATGWRWYQDCDHEDTLDVACDRHENEGGRRLAAADRENAELRGEVERLRELVAVGPWVVQAEAAEILGVSHQRISQLKAAGALPEPVAVLPGATIWRRADIEDFAAERADQRAALIEPPLPTVDEPVPTLLGDPRLPDRFWQKVVPSLGCWEWVGSRGSQGYGWFTEQPTHRAMLSHRIAYRAFRGRTDDGLHVDHLCRNPSCCNPDHLEAVTPSVNVLRGLAARAEGLPKQSAPRQWTEAEVDDLRSQLAAAQAQLAEAVRVHRDLTRRLGFGDNVTEPQADNDEIVAWYEEQCDEAAEWRESQSWRSDCAQAGHPDDQDCHEHDPSLTAAEARLEAVVKAAEDVARRIPSPFADNVVGAVKRAALSAAPQPKRDDESMLNAGGRTPEAFAFEPKRPRQPEPDTCPNLRRHMAAGERWQQGTADYKREQRSTKFRRGYESDQAVCDFCTPKCPTCERRQRRLSAPWIPKVQPEPPASDEPARNLCTCDRAKEGAAFHHPTCPSSDEPARCEHGQSKAHPMPRRMVGRRVYEDPPCPGPAASGTPDGSA